MKAFKTRKAINQAASPYEFGLKPYESGISPDGFGLSARSVVLPFIFDLSSIIF
jgi:hypothetical protein